ncbi:Single-stranded DNA-binding protein WHY2, mitochondrial [Apostasia shenzhenica]|uniref:Single-stranded DNA-binding protein WHY2, mitochondrial n=1 Tax=Apostasia shenzhenica TaxID=1088818 RepID=A0A2I0AM54_9ASPA|nr:Single-stranded DNA-binding protein WHY2, mitochondrial [Apostasia shenzhenica]
MLSRLCPRSRNVVYAASFTEKFSYIRDALCSCNLIAQHRVSTNTSEHSSGRAYADYSIFKGKAALVMTPLPARFSKMDSGGLKVDRKGVVLLKFMPAIGQRKYDYEKKQYFALSATEVGSLIGLGPTETCEFFHDPSMKSSLEGLVKKTLTVSPLGDGNGYFFNLSVLNAVQKTNERLSVPVTKAEFAVIRAACGFALPHMMGWSKVMQVQHPEHRGLLPGQRELKMVTDVW